MLSHPKSPLRRIDLAVFAAIVAHALAQIGGSILIWRGAIAIPPTIVRSVVAIEPTSPRLAKAFQVYAFNFYLWTAFCGVLACCVLASPRLRAAARSLAREERAKLLPLLAIMIIPSVILYFNMFPAAYTQGGDNILTNDSWLYIFRYAAQLSISAALWALPWSLLRIRAVEEEAMERWVRSKKAYDDARRATARDS